MSIDEVEVFDLKRFWNEFKTLDGVATKERAMAALKIFQSNGVDKPTSTALTDAIVNELKINEIRDRSTTMAYVNDFKKSS